MMSQSTWKVKVPGKLMIAGEYAILEPLQNGVVIAVDRFITAEIKWSEENILSLPQLGLQQISWINNGDYPMFNSIDSRLTFIIHAIQIMNQFFKEQCVNCKNFKLTITSELANKEGRKYGLGSSAAIVVAIVSSMLAFNKIQLSKEQIFKLAAIAHLKAQGNGSGADIAASVFGGWIHYSSYQPYWVLNELEKGTKIRALLNKTWPNLFISSLSPPRSLEFCVGWSKEVAKTGPMVQKIQRLRFTKPHLYDLFLEESSNAVDRIVKGFVTDDYKIVMTGISENRQALRKLGEFAVVPIETPKLKVLIDLADKYGKAKSSGAGGGDCGIAFIQNMDQKEELYKDWRKEGIIPLYLNVSNNGLAVTELNHCI